MTKRIKRKQKPQQQPQQQPKRKPQGAQAGNAAPQQPADIGNVGLNAGKETGKKTPISDSSVITRARTKLPSNERIISLLESFDGNISAAAKAIKCSRNYLSDEIMRDPELKSALEQIRERAIDEAEARLRELVNDRKNKQQFNAIKYYLDSMGRERGWGKASDSRVELTGKDGGPISSVNQTQVLGVDDMDKLSNDALAQLVALKKAKEEKK